MMNTNFKISIIVSKYNTEITEKLLDGALSRLMQHGFSEQQIDILRVPGAVDIPLTAQLLARSKRYRAIICLGAVIRGDTDHYEYVCQQVSNGCQQVMLEFSLPVIFGVLTTENVQQAEERVSDGNHKGIECADAAIHMIDLIDEISV